MLRPERNFPKLLSCLFGKGRSRTHRGAKTGVNRGKGLWRGGLASLSFWTGAVVWVVVLNRTLERQQRFCDKARLENYYTMMSADSFTSKKSLRTKNTAYFAVKDVILQIRLLNFLLLKIFVCSKFKLEGKLWSGCYTRICHKHPHKLRRNKVIHIVDLTPVYENSEVLWCFDSNGWGTHHM